MNSQLLVNKTLDKLPAVNFGITFTLINQGISASKIKYYVNYKHANHLYTIK